MTHLINGMWQNSYGSQMRVEVQQNGLLIGDYISSTGSSGRYLIIGYVSANEPTSSLGQGIALSIYWRSVDPSTPDDSWHWVSTYCGQLQADLQMEVINSLVASCQFEQISSADYIDKLSFKKIQSTVDLQPLLINATDSHQDQINGIWCDPSNALCLELQVTNPELGIVSGFANFQQQRFPIYGFTDTDSSGLALQSLSVSGRLTAHKQPISISGTLDIANKQLNVSAWIANSTAPGDSYLQTTMSAWTLRHKVE